jgi:hypothetical protein
LIAIGSAAVEHVQARRAAALEARDSLIELTPTGEGEASGWLQRRAQIGKSAGRLREKHDAKARKKEIESGASNQ